MLKAPFWLLAATLPLAAGAQSESWQSCSALTDDAQRLACYDAWARGQSPAATPPATGAAPAPTAPAASSPAPGPAAAAEPAEERRGIRLTAREGCHDLQFSALSRFWELEQGADCGTFGLRGYRPTTIAVASSDDVNREPTSENPRNNASTPTDYRTTEARLQLSVRTKLAQGLFMYGERGSDSLWFGYSQLSTWQVFTPELSRPFRNTDHEPEFLYVTPVQSARGGEWRLRLAGLGLVHQSNGQSLPLSRSWNRVYLLAGLERDNFQVHARVWNRIDEEGPNDDNPRISDYIGRAELVARWQAHRQNTFALTLRHSLKKEAHGSVRLEWFHTLADPGFGPPNGLRLHAQVFSGYGDTLVDYNRARTVFSLGFSLVEW